MRKIHRRRGAGWARRAKAEPRGWITRDIEVITPEGARVVFTAPREFDPNSQEARDLMATGIPAPEDGR